MRNRPNPKPVGYKQVPIWACLRCEQQFTSRDNEAPLRCPKCGSPYWSTLPTRSNAKVRPAKKKHDTKSA